MLNMTRKRFYLAALAVLVLSAGVAGGSALFDRSKASASYAYETVEVSQGEVRKVVATSGTVRPRLTVQIGSELSGRIRSIATDFNAQVKAGDLLAVIDPKTFESKAGQARADLQAAQAALINSEAAVRKARAVLSNAEKVVNRQSILGRKGFTSGASVDSSERDVNVARAEVDVAQAGVANARAIVAQKQAQLDQATIDLERTQIRSPITGIVLHRAVDVGQTVAANFQAPELFRIAGDLSSIHIEAQVSEADIGAVRAGNPVSFDVDSYPGRVFTGRVDQIRLAPAMADSVVTYMVIIDAENRSLELFPGMTANVRIETAKRDDVLRVAVDAIRFEPPRSDRKGGDGRKSSGSSPGLLSSILKTSVQTSGETGSESGPDPSQAKSKRNTDDVIARWTRRLKLDEQQIAELRRRTRAIDTDSAGVEATKSKGKKRRATQESGSSRFESVMETLLNPEQRARLEKYRKERAQTKSATVWLLSKDGTPERRSVRVGLTDVRFAELVGAELKPGEQVIVRSRRLKAQ